MRTWALVFALACMPVVGAAQSIRCDGKIIGNGTTRAEVSALCGAPAQIDRASEYHGAAVGQPNFIVGSAAEVQIEVWVYNFGPNKLMQRIRFENGTVVSIDSLGYGF